MNRFKCCIFFRSSRKETAKEEMKKQEMTDIQNAIKELYIQSEEQRTQIRELTRKLGHLGNISTI